MIYPDLSAWGNHLWQSSLCAAGVWLLTFVLKENRAALRYWLWLAASAKFLIPFSLLVGLGNHLGWRFAPPGGQPQWSLAVDDIGRSFTMPVPAIRAATLPASSLIPAILFVVWVSGLAVSVMLLLRGARHIRTARSRATPLPIDFPIPVLSSPTHLEPGLFGIRKPVLLLPEGITAILSPAQLKAILAHELCHVRRRDNLTAAIHLLAETIFWFFPVLWWMRAQLLEERERACDEEVLRWGAEPRVYAQGFLRVCEFYLESRTVCVAGVTGANLKRRIEAIMKNQIQSNLNPCKKLLLAAAALLTVAGPLVVGMMNVSPVLRAESSAQSRFDVASIRPATPNARGITIRPIAGGITITNIPVKELMVIAYRVQLYQISGGSPWINSDHYDISAKSENSPTREEIPLMLQALLADRFQLQIHRETKILPIYALLLARKDGRLGPRLVTSKAGSCTAFDPKNPPPPPEPGKAPVLPCGGLRIGPNGLSAASIKVGDLTQNFSRMLGRTVVDKTGLTEKYDISMDWTPDESQPLQTPGAPSFPSSEPDGPSVFTAIQEQLGLKFEAQKGPVETIVIDRVERPSAN